MIIMPHSRPGHRCSSQPKQTSGIPQDPDGTCRAKYADIEITADSWDQLKQNVKSFVALQWF